MKINKKCKRMVFETGEFEYFFNIELILTDYREEYLHQFMQMLQRSVMIPSEYLDGNVSERR